MTTESNSRVLLHLGCGPLVKPSRWKDLDGSWNLRMSKLPKLIRTPVLKLLGNDFKWPKHVGYLNITERLPYAEGSVDAVYASHVWEHLYFEEALAATKEVFRVLKPGGVLRLVVPNLEYFIERYQQAKGDAAATRELNRALHFRQTSRSHRLAARLYSALADFHSHKYMYDPPALVQVLEDAGFEYATQMEPFKSRIAEIDDVEIESRVVPTAGFAIEGMKPVMVPSPHFAHEAQPATASVS
jgi:SAM-dependent methyltransferase